MSSGSPTPAEEYVKIRANITNIETVWGKASSQYREADAMASEYLRNFMGSGVCVPERAQQMRSSEGAAAALPQKRESLGMNLAFRPKAPRQQ
ncbi:hypothetical protein MMC32_007339 [Xylographa parallela]|nr:hypothetical protein [Xylographa parallela]